MPRRSSTALIASLGGAMLLCLKQAPSFVAPPSSAQAEGRRAAVASLLVPLAGATAGSPAQAVNGVTFTAPDAEKWTLAKKPNYGSQGWILKDTGKLGYMFVFPTDHKASIKAIGNQMVKPTFRGPPGVEIFNYKLGEEQDDMELSVRAMSPQVAPETFTSAVVGGQGIRMPSRQWYRKVKQNGKEALVMAVVAEGKAADALRPEVEAFFNSVKIA